jgi:hypothetical protein
VRKLVNSNCMRKAFEKEGKLTVSQDGFHETLHYETAVESIDNN